MATGNITIEIDFSPKAQKVLTDILAKLSSGVDAEIMTVGEDDDAPVVKTRTRRTKAQIEEDEAEEFEASDDDTDEDESDDEDEEDAEEDDEDEEPVKASKKGREPKVEDVQEALKAYARKHGNNDKGRAKATKLMEKITGATQVSKIKPKDYAKLIAATK